MMREALYIYDGFWLFVKLLEFLRIRRLIDDPYRPLFLQNLIILLLSEVLKQVL